MGTETELKLSIDPKMVTQFCQHPMIQALGSSEQIIQMRGIYYDTPDHQLSAHKTSLRVRLEGEQWVQTVKSAGKSESGLHQRNEWESPVPDQHIVFDALPKAAKKAVFADEGLWTQLKPLFETNFERHTWQFKDDKNNQIEICLDQGLVKTSLHNEQISEIELELKNGDPLCLYNTALLLQKTIPLRVENASKAARGYQLHKISVPLAQQLPLPELKQNIHIDDAFKTSCLHALNQIQHNDTVISYHNDYDGVIALQQGILQLEASLFLYHDLLAEKPRKKFKHKIRKCQDLVANVLKWEQLQRDVQQMNAVAPKQAPLLQRLQNSIGTQRRQSYIKLRRYINSSKYSRLLLQLSAWLLQNPIISHEQGSAQLFATENLAKHYRQVLALPPSCKQDRQAQRLSTNLAIVDSLQPLPRYQRLKQQVDKLISAHASPCQIKQMHHCLEQLGVENTTPVYYFVLGWYAAKI